jgi:dihydroorotate dehydrogenase electron transfer subunit
MRQSELCKVLDNTMLTHDMYKMVLLSRNIAQAAKPGQFLHIKIPKDYSLLLRRPISIHDTDKTHRVELIYRVVGEGTKVLSSVKPGDQLDVLGPLGNGFTMPPGTKSVSIVGGGCGIAPLKFAINKWSDLNFTTFLGFRDKQAAYEVQEFQKISDVLYVTSDDGSIGKKALVTQVLEEELKRKIPDLMLACGPIPMLKVVQQLADDYRVPCQISLEERMGCGIGGCLVCSCAVRTGQGDWEYKRVCSDGPVFWSREVILDESKDGC